MSNLKQYHFDLALRLYEIDTLVVFAENLNQAWEKAVAYIKADVSDAQAQRILAQLRRHDYEPEVHPLTAPIHVQYSE